MTFEVETGSGSSTSNSYASVENANDYHDLRNNLDWQNLSYQQKEAALVYATSFIDSKFSWPGYISSTSQSLKWPRVSAFDSEGRYISSIPQRLIDAVCELAYVHAVVEPINSTFDKGGAVQEERVGQLWIKYYQNATPGVTYPFLLQMLSDIIVTGSSGVINMVRA